VKTIKSRKSFRLVFALGAISLVFVCLAGCGGGNGSNAPAAPSDLQATVGSSTQINLSWVDNSDNEDGFKVERRTGTGGIYDVVSTPSADTISWSDTGLIPSTTYYYRMYAYISVTESRYSKEVSATTDSLPTDVPAAPADLSATVFSDSEINLDWTDNSNNEEAFKIERKIGPGGTYDPAVTVLADVTSYQDTGLACGTTYYYRVTASNALGDSDYSTEIIAVTLDCSGNIPTAPSGLTATVISSSQINLYWDDNSNNEDGFKIERNTGAGATYSLIQTTAPNIISYSDGTLSTATIYIFRVYAYNSAGNSGYSNAVPSTTLACPGDEYVDMGTYYIGKYEASKLDATATSRGSETSWACSRPGVLPRVNESWESAKSTCQNSGARLCAQYEWGDACDGVIDRGIGYPGSIFPYGDDYQSLICNGLDAGKGGTVPTGSMLGCVSSFGVYDMSGNVWEWTSEVVDRGNYCMNGLCQHVYNPVYTGGCFNTPHVTSPTDQDRLRCSGEYLGGLNTSYSDGVMGFRCCRDK